VSVNGRIVINFCLQTFSIVSGVVSGKGVEFYGRKSTGIFLFSFTILSAAIDYLPNFAFYMCNEVLTPASETKTLNFEDTFEHHMLKPTTFQEAYNHKDPEQHAKWHAIIQEFKDMNNCGV